METETIRRLGPIYGVLLMGVFAVLGLVGVARRGEGSISALRAAVTTLKQSGETAFYTNDDTYSFKYSSLGNGKPGLIFSSKDGSLVITSDDKGNVWRSTDYGSTWVSSKALKVGNGAGYAEIKGLAMEDDGECMVAGTGSYATFKSSDYGASWTKLSDQKCSIIAGTSDLKKLACIGGLVTDEDAYLYYSHDNGVTWRKSTSAGSGRWVGIVSNSDFTLVAASKYTNLKYFHTSSDGGVTYQYFKYTESGELKWGSLCGSNDLSVMLITDVKTRNVHISDDYGEIWYRAFDAKDYKVQGDVDITSCAVSSEGNAWREGAGDMYLYLRKRVDVVHSREMKTNKIKAINDCIVYELFQDPSEIRAKLLKCLISEHDLAVIRAHLLTNDVDIISCTCIYDPLQVLWPTRLRTPPWTTPNLLQ